MERLPSRSLRQTGTKAKGSGKGIELSELSPQRRFWALWQGRFGSVVMDKYHLAAALRCVALNPVRTRIVASAPAFRGLAVEAECQKSPSRPMLVACRVSGSQ